MGGKWTSTEPAGGSSLIGRLNLSLVILILKFFLFLMEKSSDVFFVNTAATEFTITNKY